MAVIKGARAERAAKSAFRLDLGDLSRQGLDAIDAARREAERIRAEAVAERERIVAGAAEEGHEKGRAEGYEVGLAEGREAGREEAFGAARPRLEEAAGALASAVEPFNDLRDGLLEAGRRDAVRLALLLARRVTKRTVEVDERVAVEQVAGALGELSRRTRVSVRAHPDDRALMAEALPGLVERFDAVEHAELIADETVGRGGCVVTTDAGGVIDAGIAAQLDRMVDELWPVPVRGIEKADVPDDPDGDAEGEA